MCKFTIFDMSILPSPNLISPISKASTTPTPAKVVYTEIALNEEIISRNLTKNNSSKKEEEDEDDFDTGMIHVLTRILKMPLNHAIAQAL